jgi:hypothetical protein
MNRLFTFDVEIVGHPLMDAFLEYDAGKTDYYNSEELALRWHEFLRHRPDINGHQPSLVSLPYIVGIDGNCQKSA